MYDDKGTDLNEEVPHLSWMLSRSSILTLRERVLDIWGEDCVTQGNERQEIGHRRNEYLIERYVEAESALEYTSLLTTTTNNL